MYYLYVLLIRILIYKNILNSNIISIYVYFLIKSDYKLSKYTI